jgi:SAM-dependent methyltransferase
LIYSGLEKENLMLNTSFSFSSRNLTLSPVRAAARKWETVVRSRFDQLTVGFLVGGFSLAQVGCIFATTMPYSHLIARLMSVLWWSIYFGCFGASVGALIVLLTKRAPALLYPGLNGAAKPTTGLGYSISSGSRNGCAAGQYYPHRCDRHAASPRRQHVRERRLSVTLPNNQGNSMHPIPLPSATGPYVLATGEAAAYRLRILHSLYGPGTRRLLLDAGLRPGMRVADIGCGVGMVTAMLAQLVAPEGHVVGIDASAAQLAQAREQLHTGGTNTRFVEASATKTGLPRESFDLVYCRFLLLHLPEPERALGEMRALLKPNGILVCEDADLTTSGSEPPSALDAFADLFCRLGPTRGLDYTLGRRLFHMVQAAGFPTPEVIFNQPVVARGENKRWLELSIAEAGPAFIDARVITAEELDRTLAEMRRLTADETILAVMPRMAQVWARKPAAHPQEAA